jgi:holin-like protein
MIASLSLILLCQLAGEVVVRGFALPMPGPVIGLVLLLGLLLARDRFAVLARGPSSPRTALRLSPCSPRPSSSPCW